MTYLERWFEMAHLKRSVRVLEYIAEDINGGEAEACDVNGVCWVKLGLDLGRCQRGIRDRKVEEDHRFPVCICSQADPGGLYVEYHSQSLDSSLIVFCTYLEVPPVYFNTHFVQMSYNFLC